MNELVQKLHRFTKPGLQSRDRQIRDKATRLTTRRKMMRIGGFKAFERNSAGERLWASYHSPHSLTWRWVARINKRVGGAKTFGIRRDKHNCGSNINLLLGPIAIHVATQRPMWYRDIYTRKREDEDHAEYQAWQSEAMSREHDEPSRAVH